MPVKWNTLKVKEACDMLDDCFKRAIEPLEEAKVILEEASKIANLPQYVSQDMNTLHSRIADLCGGERREYKGSGTYSESNYQMVHHDGYLAEQVERIRKSLPASDVKAQTARAKLGDQQQLIG